MRYLAYFLLIFSKVFVYYDFKIGEYLGRLLVCKMEVWCQYISNNLHLGKELMTPQI